MTPPPGSRLLNWARRWCSDRTVARVVEPLVSDMQVEHHLARLDGRVWRARLVVALAAVSLVRTLAVSVAHDTVTGARAWSNDDQRELTRVVSVALVVMAVMTALLTVSPAVGYARHLGSERAYLVVLLVPQAVPIALPLAATWGVLFGLAGRVTSRRLQATVVTLAIVASLGSFAMLNWVVPRSNHSFRVAASGMADLRRGASEMTRSQLREHYAMSNRSLGQYRSDRLARFYYQRDALAWASLSLVLFALAVRLRRRRRLWVRAVLAFGVCWAYLAVFTISARADSVPALLGAWIPNLTFVIAALVLLARSAFRPDRLSPRTG